MRPHYALHTNLGIYTDSYPRSTSFLRFAISNENVYNIIVQFVVRTNTDSEKWYHKQVRKNKRSNRYPILLMLLRNRYKYRGVMKNIFFSTNNKKVLTVKACKKQAVTDFLLQLWMHSKIKLSDFAVFFP